MYGYGWEMMNGWGYALMAIVMLFFLVAIAIGAVIAIRSYGRKPAEGAASNTREAAEGLLAERFVKGEISDEEFLAKRIVLRGAR